MAHGYCAAALGTVEPSTDAEPCGPVDTSFDPSTFETTHHPPLKRAKPMKTQACHACGETHPVNGRGVWGDHKCPKAGEHAADPRKGWHTCPAHGILVWKVGPHSTYPACIAPGCMENVKRGGRPGAWRYYVQATKASGTPANGAPISAPTPAPIHESPPTLVDVINADPPATLITPTPVPALDLKHLGSLGEAIQDYIEARTRELTAEILAIKERTPQITVIEHRSNGTPIARIEGTHHKALPELIRLYDAGFRNFLIVGPAGSGKTTLAHDLQRSLAAAGTPGMDRWGLLSCSAGMSEGKLVGRGIPNLSTGENVYQGTPFVEIYEEGGVFLLDEIDGSDANMLVSANAALANGCMSLVDRMECPTATRHPGTVIICAANTYGTGADRMYVGRNQLDVATLDRFVGATITVDYDRDLETTLCPEDFIRERVWAVRDAVARTKMRRIVGTRFLVACRILVTRGKWTLDEAVTRCCEGWTLDELSRVGVAS